MKFNIKRDLKSPCWCEACLVGKKQDEMSFDPRYCQGCCEFLVKDAELLSGTKRPKWIPRQSLVATKAKFNVEKPIPVPPIGNGIMSTLENENIVVDKIAPPTPSRPQGRRGRKPIVLPEELIRSLADEKDMGSKAIATKLKTEQGVNISYKTIQRILAGQR